MAELLRELTIAIFQLSKYFAGISALKFLANSPAAEEKIYVNLWADATNTWLFSL